MLSILNLSVMVNRVICQAVRMVGKSFINFMLDTATGKRFYTVTKPNRISLDFHRIDAAERFALS